MFVFDDQSNLVDVTNGGVLSEFNNHALNYTLSAGWYVAIDMVDANVGAGGSGGNGGDGGTPGGAGGTGGAGLNGATAGANGTPGPV